MTELVEVGTAAPSGGSELVVARSPGSALVPAQAGGGTAVRAPLPKELMPSPIEKAAIVLTAIGPEFAAGVLGGLEERDVERFTYVVGRLGRIEQRVLDAVIVEFLEQLTIGPEVSGGARAARELLAGLVDESEIDRILSGRANLSGATVWERLGDAPLKSLVTFFQANHPQTVAMILTELRADKAAAALEEMDPDFAKSIVLRLATVPSIDPRVAEAVEEAIERDFLSVLQGNLSKRRPADLIAGLMNNISSDVREGFLSFLEAKDGPLAQDVLRTMFTFEDIRVRIGGRDVATIVREMEESVLMAALKAGEAQGSETVRHILDNLPRRLSERFVEDLSGMDPVPVKEGEAAQIELTKKIQEMAKEGTISLLDRE